MKISVVITTYSRNKPAQRALESVVNQTYTPNEIIVIEDASNSGINKWIDDNYPEVTYIKNEKNLGLTGSRNVGIKIARSEWIAFLDDDDEWMPERLEEQVQCYQTLKPSEREKLACIQCGVKKINADGKITGIQLPLNDGNLKESIMKYGASTPSSSFLFRGEALIDIGGFDENLVSGIDHDIWMKLAVAGFSTKALKKPLVIIHQEPIETMMTNTEKRIKGITQYVEKWTPTFIEWFGAEKGNKYARDYYVNVIGRLAGNKLANHQFKQFNLTIKSIWSVFGFDLLLLPKTFNKILKIYLVERITFIRKIVQKRNMRRHNIYR